MSRKFPVDRKRGVFIFYTMIESPMKFVKLFLLKTVPCIQQIYQFYS